MAMRNPFQFLDDGSRERVLLTLLLALIRRSDGGEVELSLQDLTAISDGDSLVKYPSDAGTSLVLRFARKGAEAYFLSEAPSTTTSATSPRSAHSMRPTQPEPLPPPLPSTPPRHAVHDDLDYALREEEMAQRAAAATKRRQQEARIAEGALPWRTVKPQ